MPHRRGSVGRSSQTRQGGNQARGGVRLCRVDEPGIDLLSAYGCVAVILLFHCSRAILVRVLSQNLDSQASQVGNGDVDGVDEWHM